ncbi:MAG: ABC transporter ATP-binding protein [Chloroflexota bacterium]|nr:MAG: ABC transporter ATP-binding protein [Chloroflexota bacterium]
MADNTEILPSGKTKISKMEMRGIVKRFPGVLANDQVDFDVHSGEVHALLGENGAGKSTLMRILYGLYQADEGQILIDGKEVKIESPHDAIESGIGMIHQHFMLVPTLTVAENVALGLQSSRGMLTDLDRVSERVLELADLYGLQVNPDAYVWQLAVGQQQRVEIIKALYRGAALLILDEPTAVLTPQEVSELFVTLKQMVNDGHALIFISHKLQEVMDISSRVTVLRDGRVVGQQPIENVTKGELARMMVGRELRAKPEKEEVEQEDIRLALQDVWADNDLGTPGLRGISFRLRTGEILGVAGVSGNGQRELAQVINGLRQVTKGSIHLAQRDISAAPPAEIIDQGLSYIPEERMEDGMIKEFSVAENLILREVNKRPFSRVGFLNFRAISRQSSELIEQFNVKTPSKDTPVKNLSGGNIQKLLLARELSRNPQVVVAAQPTRGLDIGATEYVHQVLIDQREEGTAILLISEDLDEILALSDRIIVIYEGEIMGEVIASQASPEELGLMMAGIRSPGGESLE